MHAHWATGDGWTDAIAAARAHRTAGKWTGVKGAVRAWLGAEKAKLTGGNRKHEMAAGFGSKETTAWISSVVAEATRTSESSDAPAAPESTGGAAAGSTATRAQQHAQNLARLEREMTVTYDAFSHYSRGKVRRTKTMTSTRVVYTARKGALRYDIRGCNHIPRGERIATAHALGWHVRSDGSEGLGEVVVRGLVPGCLRDALTAVKAMRRSKEAIVEMVRDGHWVPTSGPTTVARGVSQHGGVIQAREEPHDGSVRGSFHPHQSWGEVAHRFRNLNQMKLWFSLDGGVDPPSVGEEPPRWIACPRFVPSHQSWVEVAHRFRNLNQN